MESVIVLKLGGRALESANGDAAAAQPGGAEGAREPADAFAALGAELASLETRAVVVHGGGAEVSAWCRRMQVASSFEDGLRVTDPATLEVAAAVLAGLANKRLVARLRQAGVDAVGLSALDGGTIDAVPHPRAASLGAVGAVRAVRPALIETLLSEGRTPVIASIGDCAGALLNLNADDLAAALAGALGARALILLSDAPGLKLDGALVPRLDGPSLAAAIEHPDVQGGMRPKLIAARAAIGSGVPSVHIAAWLGPGTLGALLKGGAAGTTIVQSANGAAHDLGLAPSNSGSARGPGGAAPSTPTRGRS